MTPAPSVPAATGSFSAAQAHSVLAVQAYEAAGDSPLWTAEDRNWATRLARESGAAAQAPAAALAERARHALQRLQPRQPALATLLQMGERPAPWVLLLPIVAFIAGLAVDAIGGTQRINLLAPPVWAVVVWNLAVYLGLALPGFVTSAAVPRGLRASLVRWTAPGVRVKAGGSTPPGQAPLQAYAAAWATVAAPAALARATLLLHLGAAALALGMVAGLYLRGMVLDYRVGWQSTFLDPAAVRSVLAVVMSPASWMTGITVPDTDTIAALRVGPDAAPAAVAAASSGAGASVGASADTGASASAAPWLHLYAATLLLAVLLPRTLLALAAGWRARQQSQHVVLPLHEPYFQHLLRDLQGHAAQVQVQPHGAAPTSQAMLGLRDWLVAACGEGLQLRVAAATAYGSEDAVAALRPEPSSTPTATPTTPTTLQVLLVDLASTPEDDSHGRLLQSLRAQQPGVPLLLLTDETAFRRRFAQLPARLAERHAAWQAFARSHGAGWVSVDLERPDTAGAQQALQAALQGVVQDKTHQHRDG